MSKPKEKFAIDERLREWATPSQARYMDAIALHGGGRAAAKALGIDNAQIFHSIGRLRKHAAKMGYSPDHHMTEPVPDGFTLARHSQYFDKEGKPRNKWVIATPDKARQAEFMKAAAEAMSEDMPRLAPVAKPINSLEHLLNLYTFTDCHVGMLAWHKENLEGDWDLTIAEKTLIGCFEQMISASPRSKTCVINQLGDFLHYDGLSAVTPLHGHVLDADGRFSKMVGVAIRILRRIVDMALQHHEIVHVLMAEGNHDLASSVWLRHMFKALYENEPRVIVIDCELPYYAIKHGTTMLAFHHGHLSKMDSLPLKFATQYSEIWGSTTKRYGHSGHMHHKHEKEYSGMDWTQHPTLAARDAYAARGAWLAERAATAITYSSKFGQVGSVTVTPEMLEAA